MTTPGPEIKNLLVLARLDDREAMRVAAGMTIFGHRVRLIFMDRPVDEETAGSDQAELLELSGIVPETTVPEMGGQVRMLDTAGLAEAIARADEVISL